MPLTFLFGRYLQKQLNLTVKAASDCSPSIKSSIETFIADLKRQYLNNDQCSSPCDDYQCDNLATCVQDGYGYKCLCLHGYIGTFCENEDTNGKLSFTCFLVMHTKSTGGDLV